LYKQALMTLGDAAKAYDHCSTGTLTLRVQREPPECPVSSPACGAAPG
jgi:hypothetical protein